MLDAISWFVKKGLITKYTVPCPTCQYANEVMAANDEEAVGKLIILLQSHQTQSHPESLATPENTLRAIVMTRMTREDI